LIFHCSRKINCQGSFGWRKHFKIKNVTSNIIINGFNRISENLLEQIAIYPNPASTVLNINNAKSADIQVFDILGKTIFSQENISVNERINVSNLENGTYFIKISMDNAVITKKFLIFK
jgi:hypothetical protein